MNIYDLLNRIIENKKYSLSSNLFVETDKDKLSEEDKLIFDLLKDIASLGDRIYDEKIEFHPMLVFADGTRTFSVDDITEDNYTILHNLELNEIPLILRARIADILWTNKKEFDAAKIAADAYWQLFKLWYTDEDVIGSLDMLRRAVCITTQIKYNELHIEIQQWFNDFIDTKVTSIDAFFSLGVMRLFFKQKGFDISIILKVVDNLIYLNNDDVAKVEQAYKLKTDCLTKMKRNDDAKNNNSFLADYYLKHAEKLFQGKDFLRSELYYKKGIKLYQDNGEADKAKSAHKRLVEIQKETSKSIPPVLVEIDKKEIIDNLKVNMEGLTFEECVIRLIHMVVFEKQEDIKKRVLEEFKDSPFLFLVKREIKNKQGQTVLVLPPLDIHNPEKDPKILELYMFQNAFEKQKFNGDVWIKNALDIIRDKFEIDRSMVEFLVKDNLIIPEGREHIFQSGLCLFLNGDYYEALHILAPEIENLFRNIARMAGGLTENLQKDGSSMEKTLSSVLALPELKECYDNDILFTFRGLLNEQAGANIRNEIAHGILDEQVCSTGAYLYFGVMVIKLLSFTSAACNKILRNSDKLKHFVQPKEDMLKVKFISRKNVK